MKDLNDKPTISVNQLKHALRKMRIVDVPEDVFNLMFPDQPEMDGDILAQILKDYNT